MVTWYRENIKIEQSQDYEIYQQGDVYTLVIRCLRAEHAGRYRVRAENQHGSEEISTELMTLRQPEQPQTKRREQQVNLMPQTVPQQPHIEPQRYATPLEIQIDAPQQQQQQQRPQQSPAPCSPAVKQQRVPSSRGQPPQFMRPLQPVTAIEGRPVVLECEVVGTPQPQVQWYREEVLIERSSEIDITQHLGVSRLIIHVACLEDSGQFKAVATNSEGTRMSSTHLKVVPAQYQTPERATPSYGQSPSRMDGAPPVIEEQPRNASFLRGHTVTLTCKVRAKPPADLQWQREGRVIQSGGRFKVETISAYGETALTIFDCRPEDDGDYAVVAVNPFGRAAASAKLFYDERPPIRLPQRSQTPSHERPLTMRPVQQQPPRPMSTPPRPPSRPLYGTPSDFDTSDFPRYGAEDLEPDSPPDITQYPKGEIIIPAGRDLVLTCVTTGKPRPKVFWCKDLSQLHVSERCQMKSRPDQTHSCRLQNIQPDDAGTYTIVAVNPLGRKMETFEVRVDIPIQPRTPTPSDAGSSVPRVRTPAGQGRRPRSASEHAGILEKLSRPSFKTVPMDVTVREGQMVRFDTFVAGRPRPEVDWYYYEPGRPLPDFARMKPVVNEDSVHSLIIESTRTSDAGQYFCFARNKAGEDSFCVNLNVTPREHGEPPHFIEPLTGITTDEGEQVALRCTAVGEPVPALAWQKDNRPLQLRDDRISIAEDNGTGVVVIEGSQPGDTGWYHCTASNSAGSATTRAKLTVRPHVSRRDVAPAARSFGVRKPESPSPTPRAPHYTGPAPRPQSAPPVPHGRQRFFTRPPTLPEGQGGSPPQSPQMEEYEAGEM